MRVLSLFKTKASEIISFRYNCRFKIVCSNCFENRLFMSRKMKHGFKEKLNKTVKNHDEDQKEDYLETFEQKFHSNKSIIITTECYRKSINIWAVTLIGIITMGFIFITYESFWGNISHYFVISKYPRAAEKGSMFWLTTSVWVGVLSDAAFALMSFKRGRVYFCMLMSAVLVTLVCKSSFLIHTFVFRVFVRTFGTRLEVWSREAINGAM